MFQFGGAWSFVWPPRGDGTVLMTSTQAPLVVSVAN